MTTRRKRSNRVWLAFLPALVAALAAALLVPMAAGAATYLLRPNRTQSLQTGWSVTPGTSTADAVLNKPVTQPSVPDTSSYLTAGLGSANNYAGVGVAPAPRLRTGETVKSTTAWAYLSTATSQPLTLSLWSWWWPVGATTIPAGSPAGWYSVSPQGQLPADVLGGLAVAFSPSGTGSGSRVYASYVDVETNDPPSGAPTPSVPSTPTVTTPTPPTTIVPSKTPLTPISLATPVIKVTRGATSISVTLSCAPSAPHGCKGELVITLPLAPQAKHASVARVLAVASRCARGCRTLGHTTFSLAAGQSKKVKVHLAHSASKLLRRRHHVDLLATTMINDGSGHPQTSSSTLTLDQSGAGAKPGRHGKPGSRSKGRSRPRPQSGSQPPSSPQGPNSPAGGPNSPAGSTQGSGGKNNSGGGPKRHPSPRRKQHP